MLSSTTRRRALVAVLLLIPVVIVDLAVWPGHMNVDTLNEISHVRTGYLNNWWSPILEWVWRRAYLWFNVGPGWVLTLQCVTFMAGLYLILSVAMRQVPAALASVLIAVFPPVMGLMVLVSRDMWFLSTALVAAGCTLQGVRATGRVRLRWFVVALVFVWISEAARQNAIVGLVVLLVMIAAAVLPMLDGKRLHALSSSRARQLAAAIVAAVVASGVIYGSQLVFESAIGTHNVNPQQTIYLYDLEMLSHRTQQNLFPGAALPHIGMVQINENYTPDNVVPIIDNGVGLAPQDYPLMGHRYSLLAAAWRHAVFHHPLDYLRERLDIFGRELSLTENAEVVYHPGIDGNPFGFKLARPGLDRDLRDYFNAFTTNGYATGGLLDRAWIYLLLATVCGVVVLVRRRRDLTSIAVVALALISWGLQAGLFVGDMGVGYRLEDFTVVGGVLGVFLLVAGWRRERHEVRVEREHREPELPSPREQVPVGS